MRNHRRAVLAALTAIFLLAALAGPTDAHLRQKDGDRVSKKHARWHKKQEAQQEATGAASTQMPAAGAVATGTNLEQYEATVDGATLQELVNQGYDVTPVEDTVDGTRVLLVLSAGERGVLQAKGISLDRFGGRAARLALQEDGEFDVFRSWDEPGGIEDELRQIGGTPQYRGFLRLYDIGDSIEGRDILAIRMTQGARGRPLGRRPAVLYQGTTHAREWISTEMMMRLLNWFIQERRAENPEIVDLLETTELWFVPVVNPDGYEYTFDVERLWRKNLRDNDENGIINNSDGVDVNRNYPEHWNYDNEGSSSAFSSETYRGTGPASEPENQANIHLIEDMADFKFAISYHSFGELLLYTQGWQVLTPSADDAIYMALTGDDNNPAVDGYNPGVGADLYTTNGEFTDWAHGEAGVLAWTPEMEGDGFGFEFPDDEEMIQAEFERNLDFAINVGMSATDPDDPQSHWSVDTDELYLDLSELDPWKTNWPSSDLRVDVSYAGGSSQPVEVLAKRAIGAVTLHYRINGGSAQTAPTSESTDGDVFGGNNAYDVYYHYLRAEIPGLSMEDSVEYWFSGGGESTDHVTFEVEGDATADVLIVAAEDRTGGSNTPPYGSTVAATPNFLSYYTDAVTATGRTVAVYDVDAMGREAPDHLGVLNHYDAVVWYTGNDFVTREPGYSAGNVSRLAVDMVLEHRAYLNEGGNILYTGQRAGATENGLAGGQFYDPVANEPCLILVVPPEPDPPFLEETEFFDRCLVWSDKNDFIQYYLGAFIYNSLGNPGTTTEVEGTDAPYTGMSWFLNGADSANNQNHHASFITTSSILPTSTYPQFTSDARASYAAAGPNPFQPFDGEWYVYSNQADITYKRLMRTFDLTGVSAADAPTLTFRFSYDTEVDWDFVFVESHTVGQDDWTTLPDQNGHTNDETGMSCATSFQGGWHTLHPHLKHYQTKNPDGSCEPTGTEGSPPGEWNAHSGRSDGWEEWVIDLSDYAGSEVELSISYASDWATQGLGSFVDDIELSAGGTVLHETSFEDDGDQMDGWTVPGPPEGSDPNPNDWEVSQDVGFEEGAIVSMTPTGPDFTTLYAGFGFEAIRGADTRRDVMDASLTHLGA
jgi:hypothetical protein